MCRLLLSQGTLNSLMVFWVARKDLFNPHGKVNCQSVSTLINHTILHWVFEIATFNGAPQLNLHFD